MKNFLHLFNAKIEHGIGGEADNGFGGGLSWSTRYKYSDELQPGFELYDEIGRFNHLSSFRTQDFSAGTVVGGQIGDIRYQAGYIFGVTERATDGVLKLSIEYKF